MLIATWFLAGGTLILAASALTVLLAFRRQRRSERFKRDAEAYLTENAVKYIGWAAGVAGAVLWLAKNWNPDSKG